MRISKDGRQIDSVETWFELAPPKQGLRQWVNGRSAKELAKAFCGDGLVKVPTELASLLHSNPSLGPVEITEAWPEHKIPLDSFRGETRNADLAALAEGRTGRIAVTVEAKADESFGNPIGTVLASASVRSNIPARIEALARSLYGEPEAAAPDIRYQLLHGAVASLIFANEHHAVAAVFVVLEFHGRECSDKKLRRNADDLEDPNEPPPRTRA